MATILIILAEVVLLPEIASAASACTLSSGSSYFDGWGQDPANTTYHFEGASGYIVVRDTTLCSGPSNPAANFAGAWVMLADHNGDGWAQTGFLRRSDLSYLRWFSQSMYGRGSFPNTWVSNYSVSSEIGVRHAFYVLYDGACAYASGGTFPCERMVIDTTLVGTTTFNPFAAWATPFLPMFFGETKNLKSDIPGSAWAPTMFSGLGAEGYDNTLANMPCTMVGFNSSPARWSQSPSSCIAFNVWTAVY